MNATSEFGFLKRHLQESLSFHLNRLRMRRFIVVVFCDGYKCERKTLILCFTVKVRVTDKARAALGSTRNYIHTNFCIVSSPGFLVLQLLCRVTYKARLGLGLGLKF